MSKENIPPQFLLDTSKEVIFLLLEGISRNRKGNISMDERLSI